MSWIALVAAGLFEVLFAYCLGKARESTGAAMVGWYSGFAVSLALSMTLLVIATRSLPLGTAYAVWTGIGAAGTVIVGIVFFNEPATILRMVFLTTLLISVIGLKVVTE
jgi:quaternary ammonium compound-resistance protein SugE